MEDQYLVDGRKTVTAKIFSLLQASKTCRNDREGRESK
jgi:hypothetical protein